MLEFLSLLLGVSEQLSTLLLTLGVIYLVILLSYRFYLTRIIGKRKNLMIILGSGGHTGEMLIMLKKLNLGKFTKVIFVTSQNDSNSLKKLNETFDIHNCNNVTVVSIFRSRKVGQSYLSSVITTLVALLHSVILIFKTNPNLIVTNGPGVALPLCWIGYALNKLLVLQNLKILFIESYCRTKSLSLSGKLIKPISNRFIVLWKSLNEINPKTEYLGKII